MPDSLRILVTGGDEPLAEEVRRCAAKSQVPTTIQWLPDAAVALARIGGGDIDVLVIDPASASASGEGLVELIARLHAACPRTQTIVVSESRDWMSDLRPALASCLRQPDLPNAQAGRRSPLSQPRKVKRIGLLGAKGGVGTTTVALNAASTLAAKYPTVLAELGCGNDTLKLHVRSTARSLCPPAAALGCWWSIKDIAGLHIAFAEDIVDIENLSGQLEALAGEAEYLVLDLGSVLTPPVTAALSEIDALGLVVDLDMLSAECARRVLNTLGQPDKCPRGEIGVVVVNRASLACPFSVNELQKLVGVPVFGTVPSSGDLCSSAQKARRPMVAFDPESLAAQSLARVAYSLAGLT